jgi:hypothetical protein
MKRTVIVTTLGLIVFSFSLVVGLNEPSRGADAYQKPVPQKPVPPFAQLPKKDEPEIIRNPTIVGMGIACSNDHVYTWPG